MEHIHLENNVLFPPRARRRVGDRRRCRRPRARRHPSKTGRLRLLITAHRRLWFLFGADAARRLLHPRLLRPRGVPPGAADSRARRHRRRQRSSSPRTTSSPASRSGSPPAASSSARSGATAPTRRPTGRPTGCTASRVALLDAVGRARARRGRTPTLARRAAGGAARPAGARAAHQHLRRRRRGTVTHLGRSRRGRSRARAAHYDGLFGGAPGAATRCARPTRCRTSTVPDAGRAGGAHRVLLLDQLGCGHQAAGHATITYTNNWPHEPLVGNRPTGANVVWSIVSVVLLLAGIGALVWWTRVPRADDEPEVEAPARDPFARHHASRPRCAPSASTSASSSRCSSCRSLLGALTAHYTVEGQAFFGFPLGEYLPYALTRTWHIQTAVFWIATAFLAAGLFLAPVVGGREPRFQRLGVNVLFGALLRGRRRLARRRVRSRSTSSCGLGLVASGSAPGLRVRRPRPRLADRALRGPACCGSVLMLRGLVAGAAPPATSRARWC